MLLIWIVLLIIIGLKYFRPIWLNNTSYRKLFFVTIGIHILYGLFVTWGQYYVWLNGSEMTRILLSLPLPSETPFPDIFNWIRPLFDNNYGYFLYYILGRFWLKILISFALSGLLYLIFRIWEKYRGGFQENGPIIILVLMLISGYPNILINVALGFVFSFVYLTISRFRGVKNASIEPVFIFSTLISLLFTNIILKIVL